MKKHTLLYIFLAGLFVITSCTNLDEEVFDTMIADTYYRDKNSVIAAVTRPYEHGHWTGWDGDRWLISELTADQFVWTTKGRHGYDEGDWIRLHGHAWNADDRHILGGWNGPYQGIGQCNLILSDLRKLDYPKIGLTESDKAQHIAELRTLRAWFYLFLIDFFRSVPITEAIDEIKGRSTPEEVFAYIETEVRESLPDLPKNGRAGRWDQGGAAALLVRLYLNAEAWIGTPKYTECAAVAQDIIDGVYGTYSIDPDYRGPFRSGIKGYRSPENILEFPHAKNHYEFGWMYNATMHYQARYSLDNDWGAWNGVHLTPSRDLQGNLYPYKLGKPFEKYPDGDKRKQQFVTTSVDGDYEGFFLVGPQYTFDYERQYGYTTEPLEGTEEYNGQPLVFVDQVGRFSEGAEGLAKGSHVSNGEENSGIRLLKFPWLPMEHDLFHFNSAPEIRLAEIYYSLAECKYRGGDVPGAAALLDAVRKRNYDDAMWPAVSYVENPAMLTDDEFVDELGREFLGERHRRTDLVRWGRFGEEWWDKPADSRDMSVFPLPNRALNANPFLEPTAANE